MEEQLVKESIMYISSLIGANGKIKMDDTLRMLACINYIERNGAQKEAKKAFDRVKKARLQ